MVTTNEYAQLSAAAYESGGAGSTNTNWIRLVNAPPASPGFSASVYEKRTVNPVTGVISTEIVIAYRGTDGPFDLVADAQLAFRAGQPPQQFNDALAYYNTIATQYGAANVSVTGHSLGGAMASFVAASTGGATTATAFNSPGIANLVASVPGGYPNVTNYNTLFDPVSNLTANQIGTINTVIATTVGGIPDWFGAFIGGFGVIPAAFAGISFAFSQHRIASLISDTTFAQAVAALTNNSSYRIVYLSCPLVLDLDGDGIETVAANGYSGALFDLNNDGIRTATGWVKSDDGMLVRDINGNGSIDNGSELFGDNTLLVAGGKAADGFAALADMDSNHDGKVDSGDANFAQLQIWRDLNQNGVSDTGELFTLQAQGIQSLNATPSSTTDSTVAAGTITASSSHTRTDGTTHSLVDINFIQDTFHSSYTTEIVVPIELQTLPNISGTGRLRDLQQAAALSPALVNALNLCTASTTITARKTLVDTVLLEWAKTDPLYTTSGVTLYYSSYQTYDPNSPNIIYLRAGETYQISNPTGVPASQDIVDKVRVVDAILGTNTSSLWGPNPTKGMIDAYNAIADSLYTSLEQIRLKPLFDQIGLRFDGNAFTLDLSGVQTNLESRIAVDTVQGVWDLLSFNQLVTSNSWLKETDWASREIALFDRTLTSTPITSGVQAVLSAYGYTSVLTAQSGITLSGTTLTELLVGSAQGDTLNGGGGNDTVLGGAGNEFLFEPGNGRLHAANDAVFAMRREG